MKTFTIVAVIAFGVCVYWALIFWISRGRTGVQILTRECLTFGGFLALFAGGYFLEGHKHDGLIVALVITASSIVWRAIQIIRIIKMKR